MQGGDDLAALLAVDAADRERLEGAVLAGDPAHGALGPLVVGGRPGDVGLLGGVEEGRHAELVVEGAAVLLGDVGGLDEGGEGLVRFVRAEDEDLGGRDRVEPALDPAPDGGEEGGGADDLGSSGSGLRGCWEGGWKGRTNIRSRVSG